MTIPEALVSPILTLINGIIRLLQARTEEERIEALMVAAEDAKAEADRIRFGLPPPDPSRLP